jgi:hypothetical protein
MLLVVSPQAAVFGAHDGAGLHWAAVAVGGVAVGFGSRLGSGCTSGHGIVGLARLSPRSLVAVAVFFATGMLTAVLSRASFLRAHLYGAGNSLPPPTGSFSWTLSPAMCVMPLISVAATVALLHGVIYLRQLCVADPTVTPVPSSAPPTAIKAPELQMSEVQLQQPPRKSQNSHADSELELRAP